MLGCVCPAGHVVPPPTVVMRHSSVHLHGPLGQLWSQVPWDSPSGHELNELTCYPNSPFAFKERMLSMLHVGAGIRRSWSGSECAAEVPVLCGCASYGRAL